MARVALGSLIGAAAAAFLAPLTRGWFSPPSGGVGWVTVNAYPKGWDFAVISLLVAGTLAGGAIAALRAEGWLTPRERPFSRIAVWSGSALVFVLMVFVHDHPYQLMDPFHEGEHLTPGFLFRNGERPFTDVFLLHGLAADGGLDALVLGEPMSPLNTRRMQTVLDAVVLALLVPIAAEVTVTGAGLAAAVIASLCGLAAFWIPVFPYYRMAPVLLAVLGLLRYARSGRAAPLALAFGSSTLGLLWSLDTGTYAVLGSAAAFLAMRAARLERDPLPWKRVVAIAGGAAILPVVLLLIVGADVRQFFVDSYLLIPRVNNAAGALPAPEPFTAAGIRYFFPPVFWAFLLAGAVASWLRRQPVAAAQMVTVALLSLPLFRSAAGRVSWSHTRFAVPLLGIALVAFVLEPLTRKNRKPFAMALAIAMIFYLELGENLEAGWKLLAGWRERQTHAGLVPYPVRSGSGIYTTEENAIELGTLASYVDSLGPGTILDFSNERALYFLLERKPPVRCFDIPTLSSPELLAEAMTQLEEAPPVCVILGGYPAISTFDGLSNADRVPAMAKWIDERYPTRTQIGRFVVATR
jgi:hypothetical protein